MKFTIIILIILLLLFLPLPIKIKVEYINNNLTLKLYKHTIFSSKKGVENKYLRRAIKKDKDNLKNNKNATTSKPQKNLSIKKLYKNITYNKFKPKIKISGSLTYGLEDAALCAILYGLICNFPNLLYFLLSSIFKVKNLSLDINPKFNTFILSFGITSIFYFNIANIIYMLYLVIKSREIKEVAPK